MKIFISSTYDDLKEHRKAVRDAILRLGHQPVEMEDFGSRPEAWNRAALNAIDDCDALVGIYAHRYVSIPKDKMLSITEQEFDKAQTLGIPCYCYRVDPKHEWPTKFKDRGNQAQCLARFMKKVDMLLRSMFTSPDNLSAAVSADLGRAFFVYATSRVHILLEGEFKAFTRERKDVFIDMLAATLNIDPKQVRLMHVRPGSIEIALELPQEAAERLMSLYTAGDPVIKQLSIKGVTQASTSQGVQVQHKVEGERIKGKVKWFNNSKGYGFIASERGKDVFVRFSEIQQTEGYKSLTEGDKVEFHIEDSPNGSEAADVKKID